MIWIRPNGKLPWLPQCYFEYEKFIPREEAYMVKNWSFISAWLSGDQSQFNFEMLIASETNYKRQDLKPLIKVGVNKAVQHYHWGNTGWMRDLSTGRFSFSGNYLSKTRQGNTSSGSVGNPKLGLKAWVSAEWAGQAFSLCYDEVTKKLVVG